MCGITGVLSFRRGTFRVEDIYLRRMRDAMMHRGPDGSGIWISEDRRIGLGHRRLAIIDPTASADQPMCNEDGTLWVVFNGEIYNHADVRAELERLGKHHWKTDHSDTEVILHAFEEWGIACLERFRGMFAIGLWDARTRRLWLIRDRIGIKPLYYSIHHGRIVFASEIKALLEDPEQKRAVNEESLFHYLSFLTTPAPETLFDGIHKLTPATWLCVDENGQVTQSCYWDVWDHTQPLTGASEDEIAERILGELRTAVRLRKVSDVPVGVFLSGGIDSSTNAALFSEGERSPVKTFTIGYDADYPSCRNELCYARQVADAVGAEYHDRLLSLNDLLEFLPQMVSLQDEPLADPVCVPVYYVSKLARDNGVVVCQVGEGADELFCGYPAWKTALALQRYNELPIPRVLKKAGVGLLHVLGKGDTAKCEYLRRGAAGHALFWGGAEAFSESHKRRLLSSRLRRQFSSLSSWAVIAPIHHRFREKAWEPSTLNWMTYLDLCLRLPELLLMRVDKMSMAVALEARVPFLDHKFVELAMSIPTSVKLRDGKLKHILKRAVRGVIPDQIIDRRKQGFQVPVREWFFDRLGTKVNQELDTFCREAGLLDLSAVRQLLERGRGPQAWYLLNLALWWQQAIAQQGSQERAWLPQDGGGPGERSKQAITGAGGDASRARVPHQVKGGTYANRS
jgi:asparagine synthase (glutamine-hydrolysing)